MKRMTRQIALLLALVMVFSAIPFTAAAEELPQDGTITGVGCSLSLEGAIHINQYVSVTGFPNVDVAENGGLLIFKSPVSQDEATYENADIVCAGLTEVDGNYVQQTPGIPAKEYADELYLCVYVQDQYGRYVYSPVTPYSVQIYCESRLENSENEDMKNLAAAMLHYGTAAQMYFGYHTDDLANANICDAWPTEELDASLLTPLKDFAADVAATGDVTVVGKSLSLEGAILVNYFFEPVGFEAAEAELLVWESADEVLSVDNVSYTAELAEYRGEWWGSSRQFVAKELGKTIFACARLTDAEGNAHYSDVIAYSPEAYAANRIRKSTNPNMVTLAEKMVIYGEYAAIYFGVSENQPSQPEEEPETEKVEVSADVEVENGTVKDTVSMEIDTVKATVPGGVAVEDGTSTLTLSVQGMNKTTGDITVGETEERTSLDIHVEGVSADNTTAIVVELGAILAPGLNKGNVSLYHVENGVTNAMTRVDNETELDAHNEFYYDPVTGEVSVAMATFSEVAVVADTTAAWQGDRDYTWYSPDADTYTIANADQLAGLSAIVGGMVGQTRDSFAGKTIKLIADINLADDEENNVESKIFYPIGYYNNEGTYEKTGTAITSGFYTFEGTFDGNGHTISNFYQNTWEMKGDHNWYPATDQHYRDGMGLFGKVYGGTVENLTIENFSSDGEIATTGCVAAYADGATFRNIAIFNCNPRVYNIGNGGIVGCVGWYAKEADLKTTFTNITVDNSNKISALWGSYDVPCGGLVGQYYCTSGQTSAGTPANGGIHMENCHVSAQMDVNNDVCGNYQYYAYRYAGILLGSVSENVTVDGHVYPKMDGITANNCTVHFGDWNDYYYCELVDNTTASYTHDHQMSRLVEIKAIDGTTITYLDGTTGTVPASGRANYVIVDYTKGHGTENATCYHFLNGEVWKHEDGGEETVNGETVLKEDKQHIYLEFNNLVTGYGWGVTTKAVGDMKGVTVLDREVADSVVKFESVAADSYVTGSYLTIGELFKAIEQTEVAIDTDNVQVTVSPVGETSTVSGTYTANTTDWTQGTLVFSGTGAATVTIQDYYFCEPTTIEVTIALDRIEWDFNDGLQGWSGYNDVLVRVNSAGELRIEPNNGTQHPQAWAISGDRLHLTTGNLYRMSFRVKGQNFFNSSTQGLRVMVCNYAADGTPLEQPYALHETAILEAGVYQDYTYYFVANSVGNKDYAYSELSFNARPELGACYRDRVSIDDVTLENLGAAEAIHVQNGGFETVTNPDGFSSENQTQMFSPWIANTLAYRGSVTGHQPYEGSEMMGLQPDEFVKYSVQNFAKSGQVLINLWIRVYGKLTGTSAAFTLYVKEYGADEKPIEQGQDENGNPIYDKAIGSVTVGSTEWMSVQSLYTKPSDVKFFRIGMDASGVHWNSTFVDHVTMYQLPPTSWAWDFDDGLQGWSSSGVEILNSDGSLFIHSNYGTKVASYVSCDNHLQLTPGSRYCFSFRAKVDQILTDRTPQMQLVIRDYDANGNELGDSLTELSKTLNSTEYQDHTYEFVANSGNYPNYAYSKLIFMPRPKESITARPLIDDITLVELGAE